MKTTSVIFLYICLKNRLFRDRRKILLKSTSSLSCRPLKILMHLNIFDHLCSGADHTLKGCYYIRQGEAYVILFNGFVGHMAHLKTGDYFGEHNLHKIGL